MARVKGGHWTTHLGWWNGLQSDGSRGCGGPGWGVGVGRGKAVFRMS